MDRFFKNEKLEIPQIEKNEIKEWFDGLRERTEHHEKPLPVYNKEKFSIQDDFGAYGSVSVANKLDFQDELLTSSYSSNSVSKLDLSDKLVQLLVSTRKDTLIEYSKLKELKISSYSKTDIYDKQINSLTNVKTNTVIDQATRNYGGVNTSKYQIEKTNPKASIKIIIK